MHGMLGYLLFAGSLQIDVSQLKNSAWVVTVLAPAGTCCTPGMRYKYQCCCAVTRRSILLANA
jgi:hypothetical protein